MTLEEAERSLQAHAKTIVLLARAVEDVRLVLNGLLECMTGLRPFDFIIRGSLDIRNSGPKTPLYVGKEKSEPGEASSTAVVIHNASDNACLDATALGNSAAIQARNKDGEDCTTLDGDLRLTGSVIARNHVMQLGGGIHIQDALERNKSIDFMQPIPDPDAGPYAQKVVIGNREKRLPLTFVCPKGSELNFEVQDDTGKWQLWRLDPLKGLHHVNV